MAARNNPLINWLNLSFDTFNLLHRWFGRIVVLEILAHAIAWGASTVESTGWAAVQKAITTDPMIIFGFVVSSSQYWISSFTKRPQAVVAVVTISIQANSIFRHAFYESFKYLHIALVILVIITTYYHLTLAKVSQVTLLYGAIAVWVLERASRVLKVMYRNVSNSSKESFLLRVVPQALRHPLQHSIFPRYVVLITKFPDRKGGNENVSRGIARQCLPCYH